MYQNKLLSLSLLPLTLLGSLANTSGVSGANVSLSYVNPIGEKIGLSPSPHLTYNRYKSTVSSSSSLIDSYYSEILQNRSELTTAYEDVLNDESSSKFQIPNRKYYDFRTKDYYVDNYKSWCYYASRYNTNTCPAKVSSYYDQLIGLKPHIMINSLKGFNPNINHKVSHKPANMNYDDWTTMGIEENDKDKVNWKEQYGFLRKNIFKDSYLYFDNKDKKPFSSERYSLFVDRDIYYGSYIPMFTGFNKGRREMNGRLGFEEYDEINLSFKTLLNRAHASFVSADVLSNNPGIDWNKHTTSNYGWYNYNWPGKYNSYEHSQAIVERMWPKTDYTYGWRYLSWYKNADGTSVHMYTPVPLEQGGGRYEFKHITHDQSNRPLNDWKGDDLFHVNYDNVLKFYKPYYTLDKISYPFSLSLENIRKLTGNVKDFFGISSNFNFYLHYSYNNKVYKSSAYDIQDLIKTNWLVFNVDPTIPVYKVDNIYLSIEPKDKDRVKLINETDSNWKFGISAVESNEYTMKNELNSDPSIESINIDQITNIQLDPDISKWLSESYQ